MKNLLKILGIIALLAVIGFTTACVDNNNVGGNDENNDDTGNDENKRFYGWYGDGSASSFVINT